MSEGLTSEIELDPDLIPDITVLAIEDDTPVDNLLSETLQRLLTVCLYSSWSPGFPFLAAANVGVFYAIRQSPLVPDVFLSLGVQVPQDWREKKNRTYFTWEFGKPPDVVIEIVSNREGNELGSKLTNYARIGVPYYVVFDPLQQLGETLLHVYGLREKSYVELSESWLEQVGLGLTLWQGEFEGKQWLWLRWRDREGNLLLTGDEKAEQERQRAEQAEQRAEQLAARLKALGIELDE